MTHTTESLMALADAYAYHKALINVSNMLHSQILETDESREALRAALTEALAPLESPLLNDYVNKTVAAELKKIQAAQPVLEPCKTLYELCVKRGYAGCANTAQTTPIVVAQPVREPLHPDVVRALWHQTLVATKGPLPIEEFANVLAKHYGIGGGE